MGTQKEKPTDVVKVGTRRPGRTKGPLTQRRNLLDCLSKIRDRFQSLGLNDKCVSWAMSENQGSLVCCVSDDLTDLRILSYVIGKGVQEGRPLDEFISKVVDPVLIDKRIVIPVDGNEDCGVDALGKEVESILLELVSIYGSFGANGLDIIDAGDIRRLSGSEYEIKLHSITTGVRLVFNLGEVFEDFDCSLALSVKGELELLVPDDLAEDDDRKVAMAFVEKPLSTCTKATFSVDVTESSKTSSIVRRGSVSYHKDETRTKRSGCNLVLNRDRYIFIGNKKGDSNPHIDLGQLCPAITLRLLSRRQFLVMWKKDVVVIADIGANKFPVEKKHKPIN